MHPDNPTSADHAVAVDLTPLDAARHALARARDYTLGLQDAEGWWQSGFETNVTMDAEDLLLREFLGLHDDELIAATARWIRSKQRDDGTWATYFGGPGELSTTVEGYLALRLAGDDPDAPHMKQARIWILDQGGLEATRVFTRIWLALSGLWSWDDLPVIPPEMIYMPSWLPLNIYDWACWARQTIVALAVLQSFRPSRPLPFTVDELRTGVTPRRPPADPWARLFIVLDKALHRYRPVKSVRRAALRRCADWIIARQEKDGSWGGIQPPWVYSLMALNMLGYDVTHPIMAKGLAGLDQFTLFQDSPDGPMRTFDACQGPVWGTVLMMVGLADAGLPPDHPALVNAGRWVLGEEIRGPGDWQVRRPKLAPAGWSFSFENDVYPDNDDTAEVVLALRRVEPRNQAAIDRGLAWLTGMQSKDGGWGAFDADNTRKIVKKPPFCDFGEVIDPPSADVTAHVVEAFAAEGRAAEPAVRRGVVWLLRAQEPDGSWFGRWGANYVYGTGAVVPALIAAGVRPSKPAIRRAVAWLENHQNPDGGWGEDLRSYNDKALAGRGESTPSQTAWALLALLAAGEHGGAAAERGIRWLVQTQLADGSWDQPQFTGTGFPGDVYINYHLYRLAFPVSAIGRYLNLMQPEVAHDGDNPSS
ncbi:MAG TPA: squalene--hopene cyclase [Streptosporangiaceae bacterium]|nr:squalene--hopene cyclase [Streptosporangiaceae bacterium]